MVRDAFPVPRIYEALQAVHHCQWFSSFDSAQGYLQMPIAEADIYKDTVSLVKFKIHVLQHYGDVFRELH